MKLIIKGSAEYLAKVTNAIKDLQVTDMKKEFTGLLNEYKEIVAKPPIPSLVEGGIVGEGKIVGEAGPEMLIPLHGSAKEGIAVNSKEVKVPKKAKPQVVEITLDQIKEMVLAKSTKGHKDKIKTFLKEFGVERTPDLKVEDYKKFYEMISILQG